MFSGAVLYLVVVQMCAFPVHFHSQVMCFPHQQQSLMATSLGSFIIRQNISTCAQQISKMQFLKGNVPSDFNQPPASPSGHAINCVAKASNDHVSTFFVHNCRPESVLRSKVCHSPSLLP